MAELQVSLAFVGGVVFGCIITQIVMQRIWHAVIALSNMASGEDVGVEVRQSAMGFRADAKGDTDE